MSARGRAERRPRRAAAGARKLRDLLALLRPYRGRVVLMLIALLLATAAALAPPYLAGLAIDDGITGRRPERADADRWSPSWRRRCVNWGATYVQTYLIDWVGQRALQDLRSSSSRTSSGCRSASTRATRRAC